MDTGGDPPSPPADKSLDVLKELQNERTEPRGISAITPMLGEFLQLHTAPNTPHSSVKLPAASNNSSHDPTSFVASSSPQYQVNIPANALYLQHVSCQLISVMQTQTLP